MHGYIIYDDTMQHNKNREKNYIISNSDTGWYICADNKWKLQVRCTFNIFTEIMYTYILLCNDSKDHHGLFLLGTEDKQRWVVLTVLLTAITAWRSGTIILICFWLHCTTSMCIKIKLWELKIEDTKGYLSDEIVSE